MKKYLLKFRDKYGNVLASKEIYEFNIRNAKSIAKWLLRMSMQEDIVSVETKRIYKKYDK